MPTPSQLLIGRTLRALALANGDEDAARAFVAGQGNWTNRGEVDRSIVEMTTRSAVSAQSFANLPSAPAGDAYVAVIRSGTIIGKLTSVLHAPPRTRVIFGNTGTRGGIVAEGAAAPVSAEAFSSQIVIPHKIVATAFITSELARYAGPQGDAAILADLTPAARVAEDLAFMDASLGILASASPLTSSGSSIAAVDSDVYALQQAALAAGANLESAALVTGTREATYLLSLRTTNGDKAFPGVSLTGVGTLGGLPLIVSASANGVLALLVQQGIAIADGAAVVSTSSQGAVELTSTPTGSSTTPVSTQLVSLFQTNTIGLMSVVYTGWASRAGSVQFMSVSY